MLNVSGFLFIHFQDKDAFRPKKWINLQIPIDESTICNAALSHPSELELIQVEQRPAPTTSYEEPKPYTAVNFVLSK